MNNLASILARTALCISSLLACNLPVRSELNIVNMSKHVPVMTQTAHSPILHFCVKKTDERTIKLDKMVLNLEGNTDPEDIVSVALFKGSVKKDNYSEFVPDSLVIEVKCEENKLIITPGITLSQDSTDFWITMTLKDEAFRPDARLGIDLNEVIAGNRSYSPESVNSGLRRIGVAVRKHGQDGIDTSRIPGLITTNDGTIIVLYDARNERGDDLQGDIDIAINRSTDGGKTWGSVIRVLDMGEYGGLPQRYNGVSDGSILVDSSNGRLYATGIWMHGINDPKTGKWVEHLTDTSTVWNHQWRSFGSNPGYDIHGTSQFLIASSDDDGKTWSEPINITRQIKKEKDWLFAPAPGRGIVTQNGTLVFPAQGRDSVGMAYSTIIYSNDGGETWIPGEPATFNTNECQVVELSDGSLMLNARHRANRRLREGNGRAVSITKDLGKTWTEHPTSRKALIEPTCQGSLYRHDYVLDGEKKHVLLFSNPSDTDRRINQTLKVSFDDGMTWPEEYWILLDEGLGAGYSCITAIDGETIGIFYEGSQADIQFQAIPFNEIIREQTR